MNEALKPCPFCSGKAFVATVEHDKEYRPHGYRFHGQIMCRRCQATAGTTGFDTIYDTATLKAITAWNTLAEPKAKPLTIEELQSLETLEWVWIEVIHPTETHESGYKRKQADYTRGRVFCCGWPGCGFHYGYDDYGETWLAYDRSPKEY